MIGSIMTKNKNDILMTVEEQSKKISADAKVLAITILQSTGYSFGDIQKDRSNSSGVYYYVGCLSDSINLSRNRMEQVLKSWIKKGWYEYQVSINTGWLTDDGLNQLMAIARGQ